MCDNLLKTRDIAICFQTDGQKAHSRGSTRFHSQSIAEPDNFPVSSTETSKPHRDKSTRSESTLDLKKHESHVARESLIGSRPEPSKTIAGPADAASRTNARHSNSDLGNPRNRPKSLTAPFSRGEVAKVRRDGNKESALVLQMPRRTASRRMSSETPSFVLGNNGKLDLEVFTKSPNRVRSRTGRKIYTNYERELSSQTARSKKFPSKNTEDTKDPSDGSKKETKSQSEYSRKFTEITENVTSKGNVHLASRRIDTMSLNNSNDQNNSNERIKERDLPLSGSESVRVDIPLTGDQNDTNAVSNLSTAATTSSVSSRQVARPVKEKLDSNDITRSSTKKNKQSDRSKSRGRPKSTKNRNFETTNPGNVSRKRDPSTATLAETNGRSSNTRSRSNAKSTNSRSRSVQKSREAATGARSNGNRGRNADTDLGVSTNAQTETRRSLPNDRRTPEAKRKSGDSRSAKFTETRTEEREVRAQSRARSRAVSGQGKFDLSIERIQHA